MSQVLRTIHLECGVDPGFSPFNPMGEEQKERSFLPSMSCITILTQPHLSITTNHHTPHGLHHQAPPPHRSCSPCLPLSHRPPVPLGDRWREGTRPSPLRRLVSIGRDKGEEEEQGHCLAPLRRGHHDSLQHTPATSLFCLTARRTVILGRRDGPFPPHLGSATRRSKGCTLTLRRVSQNCSTASLVSPTVLHENRTGREKYEEEGDGGTRRTRVAPHRGPRCLTSHLPFRRTRPP